MEEPRNLFVTLPYTQQLVGMFLNAPSLRVKIAVADLLANLSQDTEYSVMIIVELDDRKPLSFENKSGVVFIVELCTSFLDEGLRVSTEAMAHNLAWSDRKNKKKIQRLCISSYLSNMLLSHRMLETGEVDQDLSEE